MTTEQARLGRLDRVDLREIWTSESADFTPWLAETDNLVILGDTIGLELELESQETKVGPFRADILCRDTGTNAWVLIENQLERTDHCHLGQLLTYAAGLKAVTVVWIAERFTEEHRAALDWLNEITDEKFAFFGLEIELWQIASSPVAPKFNVVCKPNDWSKTISEAAEGEITETKLLQQEYWASLRDLLLERKSIVKPQKPRPQHWTNFAVGRSFFGIHATVNTVKNWLQVGMSLYWPPWQGAFPDTQATEERDRDGDWMPVGVGRTTRQEREPDRLEEVWCRCCGSRKMVIPARLACREAGGIPQGVRTTSQGLECGGLAAIRRRIVPVVTCSDGLAG